MRKVIILSILAVVFISCSEQTKKRPEQTTVSKTLKQEKMIKKAINQSLPTIGILIFEGVIINEVVAPLDVFSNPNTDGKQLFNVITIATENKTYKSAHGLKIAPDYLTDSIPSLKVLVIPSSYDPIQQTSDKKLVDFIKEQDKTTEHIASHCAGAFLIGESGIAKGKEIVTYCGGGKSLQEEYPNLLVADDSKVSVVHDGKFISSNGSLISYVASFDLLEKLTNKEHRKFVETSILFDRLK